ncbi:MAG TPA: tail fiber domain-containing protein, partial [bacterium]|nr:tail fiber domain-containing protein [bacterium]
GALSLDKITAPADTTGYGKVYVNSTDSKLYFKDGLGGTFDLTATGGSGTIADGDTNGQMAFWNETLGTWEYTDTSEMVWDDTDKALGIGVASPTATNKLHIDNTGTTTLSAAVYATATSGGAAIRNYGGYFSADGTIARAVEGRATTTGAYTNYGGYFVASGDTGYGVYALANSTTGWAGYFDGRAGVGQAFYVGQAGGTDDDYVYFDAGGEYIKYNNAQGFFDFSASSIAVGMASASDDDYIRFDDGTNEYLMWNNTTAGFELSDDLNITGTFDASSTITAGGNIYTNSSYVYIDNDFSYAYDYIYFGGTSATSDYIRYYSTADTFYFTGALVSPTSYSTVVGATNRDLYIDSGGNLGYVSSSLRYKDNVKDMEDINWLYNLRPVNYTYKSDENKSKQYGLIAEEVEKVNPFFVSYDEEGLPETVSYSALVTPMLEAIQNQKQQLDALETKVEMIEKMVVLITKRC